MNTFKKEMIQTWKVFQGNWGSFLLIFVINIISTLICFIPLGLAFAKLNITDTMTPESMLALIQNFNFLISVAISGVLMLAVYILCLTASFNLANGEKSLKTAFKNAFLSFGKMYLMTLFGMSIAVLGFLCFIIPGILILFFLSFIYPIAIVEKTSIIETMKQSYTLIKANWKFVASRFILFALVSMILNAITSILNLGYLASDVSIIFLPIFYIIIYKEIKNK